MSAPPPAGDGPIPLRNLSTPSTSFGVGIRPVRFGIVGRCEMDCESM